VTEDYVLQGSPAGFTIPLDLDGDGDIEVFPEGRNGRLTTSFDIFSGECRGIYRPGVSHTFVLGAAVQETRQFDNYTDSNFSRQTNAALDPGELDTSPSFIDNRRTVWALFLQDQWNVSEELDVTFGLRYDHYSDFGSTTNPRAALVWGIRPNLTLKVLYGRAFLAPSFHELYLMNNPLMVGSDDLQPATIQTFEVGSTYSINEQITARMTYFYNVDEHIITPAVQADPNMPATFVNVDGDVVQGIEMELEARFSDQLYGFLNYSFRESKTQETGETVPLNPAHLARAGVNFPLFGVVNANLQAAFVGERPRELHDSRDPVDAYVLVDATLRTHNIYKGLELFCSVHNLLDAAYVKPSLSDTFPGDYPLPGRTLLLGLRSAF
jgi:iron complex outermembrane receptor protein